MRDAMGEMPGDVTHYSLHVGMLGYLVAVPGARKVKRWHEVDAIEVSTRRQGLLIRCIWSRVICSLVYIR